MSGESPRDGERPQGGRSRERRRLEALRRKLARAFFMLDPLEVDDRLAALDGAASESKTALETLGNGFREHRTALEEHQTAVEKLQRELAAVRDDRLSSTENRLDAVEGAHRELQSAAEAAHRKLQSALESLGEGRLAKAEGRMQTAERRLDAAERSLAAVGTEVSAVRDERLPAVAERTDVLIDRLAEEVEEVASLVERILLREPLPVPASSPQEDRLAQSLAEVQPALIEAFRGGEEEIRHRLERYLPVLANRTPVLDLGCGRGELLLLLREAGIGATGVEADPALAQAARRRGLTVIEGDAETVLAEQPADGWGAITAVHLLEHLAPARQLALLYAAYRVLQPGGELIIECPNPHNLRVGASLFWLDPTHRRPLMPETLAVMLRACGFRVHEAEPLHPFPAEQRLAETVEDPSQLGRRLARLEERLDELLNGPRDFTVRAVRPVAEEQ